MRSNLNRDLWLGFTDIWGIKPTICGDVIGNISSTCDFWVCLKMVDTTIYGHCNGNMMINHHMLGCCPKFSDKPICRPQMNGLNIES
jgi:hypothetical protein